jgi:hypothetical protein
MYSEHRQALASFQERLRAPEVPVTSETRLILASELAFDVLALLPEDAEKVPEAELVNWVNVTYDVMLAVIDLWKNSLDMPKVPGGRKQDPPASA